MYFDNDINIINLIIVCFSGTMIIYIVYSSYLTVLFFPRPVNKYLWRQLNNEGVSHCDFLLTSYKKSDWFFDFDFFLLSKERSDQYTKWLVSTINEIKDTDKNPFCLVFIEKDSGPIGLLSLKEYLSITTNTPSFIVRPRRFPFLPVASFKGELPYDKKYDYNCLIISDVATTGGHLNQAIEMIESEYISGKVTHCIVLLNRGEEKVKSNFQKRGITLISNDTVGSTFLRLDNTRKK